MPSASKTPPNGFFGELGEPGEEQVSGQAEKRLQRQNVLLAGINRIFQKALSCETEEELGRVCLAVAEEATGSQFGFLGEIGPDGLLHDIAVSESGWKACTMHEAGGLRTGFPLSGIFGLVLRNDASLIANDPALHSDSVGISECHPPLTAFLGVPLRQAGRTIGMIGLGNKPGGYDQEDQEAAEAVAAVTLETLFRKRAEAARKETEELLHQFIEYVPAAIAMFDRDMRYLAVSRHWLKNFGLEGPILGRSHYEIFPDLPGHWKEIHRRCLEGSVERVEEAFFERADGRAHWLKGEIRPWRKSSGAIGGIVISSVDITERKLAEEALRRSEERLNLALDSGQMGMWEWDVQSQQSVWNVKEYELLGLPPGSGNVHTDTFFSRVHPDDLEAFNRGLGKVMQEGSDWRDEYRIILPDGQVRWLAGVGRLLRGPDGQPLRMIGVNYDITERKRAEEALRRSEERLNLALDSGQMGMWEWDVQSQQSVWNVKEYELLGLPPGSGLVHTDTFFSRVHPDDLEAFNHGLAEVMMEGSDWRDECRIILPDGRVRWLAGVGRLLRDPDGQPRRMIGVNYDITERKLAEEDLRKARQESETRAVMLDSTLNAIGEGLMVFGLGGEIVRMNPFAERVFRYTPEERTLPFRERLKSLDITTEDGTSPSLEDLPGFRALRGETVTGEVLCFQCQGDDPVWISVNAAPIRDQAGTLIGSIATFQDTTERKHIREQLLRAKEAAEKANRAKSEFLANMSHEIRTPMNGVLGMTDLVLLIKGLPPQAAEYLGMLKQSGKALLNIINDILDISKIESGRAELVHEEFDLGAVLRTALSPLLISATGKGLRLLQAVHPDVPDRLVGDQGRLCQILTNLVGNAVKFTSRGQVSVSVGVQGRPDPESIRLLFRIDDSGIGIPANHLERIFESFAQVGGSAHAKYGGTGLGLAISKSLVELMNGEIGVESMVGRGSSFFFTATFGRAGEHARCEPVEAVHQQAAFKGLRVLVAEDDPVNQLLAVSLLKRLGHHVEVAHNGRQAVEVIKNGKFDLVLMDVCMPDMNGEEAVAAIRHGDAWEENARVPVVALTAYALRGDRERFLAAGMDDYLAKPIDFEELDRVLSYVMTGRAFSS
ncbi:MAG: PAS domain S-box protein [Acidobacteriota bacterium]